MRIEGYFQQMRKAIEACDIVQTFDLTYDKRSTYEGFIRGEIYFIDGSVLHMREFIDSEDDPERLAYVYQYMDAKQHLIFRYDNTGHHKELNLTTYPHHKHVGSETNLVPSTAPDLSDVLNEIDSQIEL